MTPKCVFQANDLVGENPTWDWRSQCLFWVDNRRDLLRRLDPATGAVTDWTLPEAVGSFALTTDASKLLLGLHSGAAVFDIDSLALTLFAPAPHDTGRFRFSDGHCDRAGVYVVGSGDGEKQTPLDQTSAFYQVGRGAFRMLVPGVNVSNGLAFSPDNRTLYRSEFLQRLILAHDYDSGAGTVSNPRVFAEIPEGWGMPDGAAVDSEGGYWVALFNGGRIVRFSADGRLDREVRISAAQPTMVAFGGEDLRTVYVTSAQFGPLPDKGEAAGSVFAFEVDIPGLPEAFVTL